MSKYQEYNYNYATVKARGIAEEDYTYTVTSHKNPVLRKGYEFARVYEDRMIIELTKNKSEKNKEEETKEADARFINSVIRSKQNVIQYVANNKWKYFVTLSISPTSDADRYNLEDCKKKVLEFFVNYSRRSGEETEFKYVLIPEFHKDGAVHFHGVMKGINEKDLKQNQYGYLDFVPYCERFGFCNMGIIRDTKKCASYISKYISKDMFINEKMPSGTHLYFASKGLKKDKLIIEGIAKVELKEFIGSGKYEVFESEYCTKIYMDNKEDAVSCVERFSQAYKTGVNIPVKKMTSEQKDTMKKRIKNKYCNEVGMSPNSISLGAFWSEAMKNEAIILNKYDRLKEEKRAINEHLQQNNGYKEEPCTYTELPKEFRTLSEMVEIKLVQQYEEISLISHDTINGKTKNNPIENDVKKDTKTLIELAELNINERYPKLPKAK